MEDTSEFLLFPELDEQLPSSESIVDYADVEEDRGDIQEIAHQNIESFNDGTKKKKRGRGRPMGQKSLLERRLEANSREKKRMRALVRSLCFYVCKI